MGSVHTVFTVSQVFAAPLGSRPNVQAEQGSPTKATSSFTCWVAVQSDFLPCSLTLGPTHKSFGLYFSTPQPSFSFVTSFLYST